MARERVVRLEMELSRARRAAKIQLVASKEEVKQLELECEDLRERVDRPRESPPVLEESQTHERLLLRLQEEKFQLLVGHPFLHV